MTNTALTDLTANTTPALTDLVYIVDDPAGTPLSQKMTVQTLLNFIRAVPYVAKTADYVATANDEFIAVDATSAQATVTLPAVATAPVGKRYVVKKVDSSGNAASVNPNSTETIDGSATTIDITAQYEAITIVNTGAAWLVESRYIPA